jgi:glycosyltransferase involved in cell wall biosynthesis
VVKHFLAADCFVFPSLFEGGGIVLYEACAGALGIIQSAFCGDGVRGGRNGTILTDVSPGHVRAAIAFVVDNPERLASWQQASWDMRLDCTWRRYREQARRVADE